MRITYIYMWFAAYIYVVRSIYICGSQHIYMWFAVMKVVIQRILLRHLELLRMQYVCLYTHANTHIHMHIFIYVYINICGGFGAH